MILKESIEKAQYKWQIKRMLVIQDLTLDIVSELDSEQSLFSPNVPGAPD